MRFNSYGVNPRRTQNVTGAVAYDPPTPEQTLYAITACSTLTPSFYSMANSLVHEIFACADECDPNFVAKLAIYLRTKMYLRTAPILLCGYLARRGKLTKETVYAVIQRADEIKELLACWQGLSGRHDLKKMPNQLKSGIAMAFNKFNSYQFRKYNKGGKEVITFKDAMRLVHPKPLTSEQNEVFNQIKTETLPQIETWETVFTSNPDKKETWSFLLRQHKLPYMAALRNIRNIIQAQVDLSDYNLLLDLISDRKQVLNSKQFPFRFLSAVRALDYLGDVRVKPTIDALEVAIQHSVDNIPGIADYKDKSVFMACDVSGSMQSPLNGYQGMDLMSVGILLAKMFIQRIRYVATGVFAAKFQPHTFSTSILGNETLPSVGHSTYAHLVLDYLNEQGIEFDSVMIFSDMAMYDLVNGGHPERNLFEQGWNQYKNRFPNTKLFLFNLAEYGTTPVDLVNKDVFLISGFSDKIFEAMDSWPNVKRIIEES